jgi:hypothetical protein
VGEGEIVVDVGGDAPSALSVPFSNLSDRPGPASSLRWFLPRDTSEPREGIAIMSALVYLPAFAMLLLALGAAVVVEPIASEKATRYRPLLLGFASLAVPLTLLALLLFGLRILLD